MKFLWLSWKDSWHPQAGGAEKILDTLCRHLVANGHEVTILTASYPGASRTEKTADGIEYIRVGSNRYTHSFRALAHYLWRLRSKYDVVVEVVNTAPYLSVLFGGSAKRLLFYHQLAREVWFHETSPGVSHIGYFLLEPIATRLLAASRVPAIAMSESTKRDLERFGFRTVHVVRQGHELEPIASLAPADKGVPTVLSFGTMRSMKRTLDQIQAFELAKQRIPALRLKLAGKADSNYGAQVLSAIKNSPYTSDIEYLGPVTTAQKRDLMLACDIIVVTSVKEGWGLIVTEAASQGTPAVVYDVDGLRDSVKHDHTGVITEQNPQALADGIVSLLADREKYERLRVDGWQLSKQLTPEQTYQDFMQVVNAL